MRKTDKIEKQNILSNYEIFGKCQFNLKNKAFNNIFMTVIT